MTKPHNYRAVLGVIFLVALAMVGLNLGRPAHATAAGGAPVTVLNTNANPVPVTGAVTVSNTPSVSLASGSLVGINGTPTVNVANLPAVQSVSFSNGVGNPLYTRDVDGPARQPFATDVYCDTTQTLDYLNLPCAAPSIPVPNGMELVVETVNASASIPSGEHAYAQIRVVTNGTQTITSLPLTFMGTDELAAGRLQDAMAFSQPLRLYGDGGKNLEFFGQEHGSFASPGAPESPAIGGGLFRFGVRGYLVSCSNSGLGACPP